MHNQTCPTVLVTGATGFIGRALVSRLSHRICVRAAVRHETALSCETFKVGEVHGTTDWGRTLRGVDVVVHLAAYAHVTNPKKIDLGLLRRTNVEGTANLARQAAQSGVKQFVFLSSIGAVTDSSESIVSATTPCLPTTAYGKSKLLAENALKDAAQGLGMEWTIIRPPLVYGLGNPGNMERLLKLIRSGVPLPLGLVRNRRSFIYVENLVDLISKCVGNAKAFGKVYLPSDGEDVSTPELIRAIARANADVEQGAGSREHGSKSSDSVGDRETSHTPHTARHSARLFHFPPILLNAAGRLPGLGALHKLTSSLYVDSEPLRRDLGWTPPFTMEEGLWRTWAKTQNS
jgi:nucleoside-diphosphate-sugar epimerase